MLLNVKPHQDAFFKKLLPNSIAILPGEVIKYRSKDVAYPFRQNSDFYYLTAYPEPNALAIFIKGNKNSKDYNDQKFILFNQSINIAHQIWNGTLLGQEEAIRQYGADEAYPIDKLNQILPELLLGKELVYYPKFNYYDILQNTIDLFKIDYIHKLKNYLNANNSNLNYLFQWKLLLLDFLKKNPEIQIVSENKFREQQDLLSIIHELRLIKSPYELENIRYVTKISAAAHQHLMHYIAANRNLTEKHVQAEFYKYCLQHGCEDMAYHPIVASGNNACTLHYHKNNAALKDNELLLIDAGAEYNNYAADITRVLPIGGKFSDYQREIYNLVLFAQKQAILKMQPGELLANIQLAIVEILVQGMIDLKILSGNINDLIEKQTYKEFYMHGSGHFLGLDVHDVGNYIINGTSIALSPGMVLTVEPGLYFPLNKKTYSHNNTTFQIAHQWQGMGIRIEDDILITKKGYEVLTYNAIKEIDEIENLMLNI